MAVPIVSFVGRSNSGKTTLIERVIPELVRAGYKVATVKHAGHGFDLDTEGKDSWRHKQSRRQQRDGALQGQYGDVCRCVRSDECRRSAGSVSRRHL